MNEQILMDTKDFCQSVLLFLFGEKTAYGASEKIFARSLICKYAETYEV
jgi:hypothetical protein